MADFPLSVLDQSPIVEGATPVEAIYRTLALARLADQLGYHRYWLAEHHGLLGQADASPEILLARLGVETKGIRIGTGGIMLPYYASFKIAEQFRMLEALYPGRIDLGLGRAPGGHGRTARVLFDGKPMDSEEGFVRQLMELSAIFKGTRCRTAIRCTARSPIRPGQQRPRCGCLVHRLEARHSRRISGCGLRLRTSSMPTPVLRLVAPIGSTSAQGTRKRRVSRSR